MAPVQSAVSHRRRRNLKFAVTVTVFDYLRRSGFPFVYCPCCDVRYLDFSGNALSGSLTTALINANGINLMSGVGYEYRPHSVLDPLCFTRWWQSCSPSHCNDLRRFWQVPGLAQQSILGHTFVRRSCRTAWLPVRLSLFGVFSLCDFVHDRNDSTCRLCSAHGFTSSLCEQVPGSKHERAERQFKLYQQRVTRHYNAENSQ